MATHKTSVTHSQERRTYVRGRFLGKYRGIYDDLKNSNLYDRFHNIKIYEGLLMVEDPSQIRKHPAGPFPDFDPEDMYPGKLPSPLPCKVNLGQGLESYHLNVWEPALKKGSVKILHSQEQGNESFGVIEAEMSGYLKDMLTWKEEIETDVESVPAADSIFKTDIPTGNVQANGNYRREEYYFSNHKDTYWGAWKYNDATSVADGCGSVFGIIVSVALLLAFIYAIGWNGLGIILLIAVGLILLSFIQRAAAAIGTILAILFICGFISSVASLSKGRKRVKQDTVQQNDRRETSDTVTQAITPDSTARFIAHHRIWNDYDGKTYEGNLIMPVSWLNESTDFRLHLPGEFTNPGSYDRILQQLINHDDPLLIRIYHLFDSIGRANNMNRQAFAEMTVSCVQDIPYRLILPNTCQASAYNDQFINQYLTAGKECEPNIRYGLFAPAEFAANLKGDCDTRTILLFDILAHFNYDVAILSSEIYNHSLIAVALPFTGSHKEIDGQSFYAWETTNKGFIPGILSPEIDNMDNWRISLLHHSIN